jgi:hypothetical protein
MVPIETAGFDAEGVTLTPSTGPGFDARAQAILSGHASPVLGLKPYLVIVSNRNPRTIVAYTVSWTVTRRNDSTETNHTQFKFPDAVAGTGNGLSVLQGREIGTGEERLVGMGFEVWPAEYVDSYRDFGQHAIDRLGEIRNLRIELEVVVGLELGSAGDDVFAPLRHTAAAPPRPSTLDPMAVYAREAAAEILGWRDRILLEVFRRALRREPFSIKREG